MKYDLTLLIIGIIAVVSSFYTSYLCRSNCIPCSGWDVINPVCQANFVACNAGNLGCLGAATAFGMFLFWGGVIIIGLWLIKDVLLSKKGRK